MSLWSILLLQSIPPKLRVMCFGSLGALVGMGAYVAVVSNAVSYLSDTPETCINCHVMTPMYASWQHSSHANVASCNDCHVPQDTLIRKYAFKAMDGIRHSTVFTLRAEPHVIRATPTAREVIQQNCIRCHGDRAHPPLTQPRITRSCVECHREVPHGRVNSLASTPNAAVPPLSPVIPDWLTGAMENQDRQP